MRALAFTTLGIIACSSPAPDAGRTPPDSSEHADHADHQSATVHHRFDDAQQWAKVFDDPQRDTWQKPELVVAWLRLREADVVGDLGAGTGYFAVRIAQQVPKGRVLANDIEPDMVRYLGERAQREGLDNLVPVQGNASAAGFGADEALDLIFVCDVYHHINDRSAFFRSLAGSLAPDGRIVIVDFDPAAAADAPGPPAKMRLSAETITAELAEAGYALGRRDDDTLPHQYMLEFSRVAR